MLSLTVSELLQCLENDIVNLNTINNYKSDKKLNLSQEICHISIDSRNIKQNSIYIALLGNSNDSHEYLSDLNTNDVLLAIVSKLNSEISLPQIQVADTKKAMGVIAKFLSNKWDKPAVSITGTTGKTTTKFILNSILKTNGKIFCSQASFNNDIGVPLTMFDAEASQWAGIFEMGTNHPGEIEYLAHLVNYDVGILTNVSEGHIENFESVDAIALEKSSIFKGIKPNGLAVINYDSRYYNFLREQVAIINNAEDYNIRIVSFGLNSSADIFAEDIQVLPFETRFRLVNNIINKSTDLVLPLLGKHQVLNTLAAVAAALELGLGFEQIKQGLLNIEPIPKRMQASQINGNLTIIDDSYNANAASVTSALEFLASLNGHKIFVLGDLGELGDLTQSTHENIGRLARKLNIDCILAYGDNSKYTIESFANGDLNSTHKAENISSNKFAHKDELVNTLLENIRILDFKQPCTVLIKGSNYMKMWEITEALQAKLANNMAT